MEAAEVPESIINNPVGAEAVKPVVSYTEDQKKYIKDHYGLEAGEGIFVTRSQIDKTLPTSERSCSLISPFGQDSFYLPTGFIFELDSDSIPWVNNGDAGTPMVSKNSQKPETALSIEEYLAMTKAPNTKYTETLIDFHFGKADSLRAIYDFREAPPKPGLKLKIVNPNKYKQMENDITDFLDIRAEWKNAAEKLNVPFITELPDAAIVDNIRSEDKIISNNFSNFPLTVH